MPFKKTVPGSLNDRAIKFFEEIGTTNKCICLLCAEKSKQYSTNNPSNLRIHILNAHTETYNNEVDTKNNIDYAKKRLKKLQSFVECVTVNGRPFQWLLDSGFKKANESELKELCDAGYKISLTKDFTEIKQYMAHVSDQIQMKIKAETQNKLVSMCIDITKKNRRAILGVSVQYLHDKKFRSEALV